MKKYILCFVALYAFINIGLDAQNFNYNLSDGPISLPRLQDALKQYTDTASLKEVKHWKYLKRWEHELSMHANGKGNPGDAADMFRYMSRRNSQNNLSKSFNANWFPVGPDVIPANFTGYLENGIGRVNCIGFDPLNAQVLYAGIAQGGLWKTTNGGQTWTPLTDDLLITRISDICINPNNPQEIYISLCDFEYVGIGLDLDNRKRYPHYGLGVYKSTDGGASWNPTGLGFTLQEGDASLIRRILINPSNTNELVACGVSGMYKSTDAGSTWEQIADNFYWDLIPHPTQGNTLYAAGGWLYNANQGYAAIYRSDDFGSTWTELNTGIPPTGEVQRIKLAISASNPNIIQAITVNTQSGLYGFYKSTDGGNSWNFNYPGLNILEAFEGNGTGGQGTYDLVLHIDNDNPQKVYAGGVNLWMSDDGGETFNPASHWTLYYGPTVHADMHYLTQHPITNEFYLCNDGSIYRTNLIESQTWESAQNGNPWPSQWENIGNGMQVTSFYRLSSDKQQYYQLLAGAQDNATSYFSGTDWYAVFGGDGMDNWMSEQVPGIALGSSQFGNIYWTSDGGISDVQGSNANVNNESGDWTTPIEQCPVAPNSLYIGFENVSVSYDEGMFWEVPGSIGGASTPLTSIAVAPDNCDIVYVSKRLNYLQDIPSRVYRSINGTQTWQNVTNGLPDSLFYSSLAISPLNNSTVVLSIAAFSPGLKVFRSSNSGQSWQNISYNLPDVPVNMLKFLPGTNDLLAATDAGIFILRNGSSLWVDESFGLPNVIVSDIEINEAANKIFVSTFGRGIWASDLDVLLSATKLEKCEPEISFTQNADHIGFTMNNYQCEPKLSVIEIIDIKGRVVQRSSFQGTTWSASASSLNSGLYFLRLSGDNYSKVQKFAIVR